MASPFTRALSTVLATSAGQRALGAVARIMAPVLDVEERVRELLQPGWVPTREFDADEIRDVVAAHEQGDFSQSGALADVMGRNARIFGALQTRVFGVLGLPFAVTPADAASDTSKAIADDVARAWEFICPESVLAEVLKWRALCGFAIGELVWTSRWDAARGQWQWLPRMKVWHPYWIRWDQTRAKFTVQTQRGIEVVTPGDGRWVLFSYSDQRGWMDGVVRCLALPDVTREDAVTDWARWCEKHGLPIVVAEVPMGGSDGDKKLFFNRLRKLGRETTVIAPKDADGKGYGVSLVEAKDTAWEGFKELIARQDGDVAIALNGTNLATENTSVGSRASSQTGRDISNDLKVADTRMIRTVCFAQIVVVYVAFNHGPAAIEHAPHVGYVAEEPEDRKATADALSTFATALKTFKDAEVPVDIPKLCEAQGVPLKVVEHDDPATGQLFQYHLTFGIVTKNEARARLGLPPIAGGDVPATPMADAAGEAPPAGLALPPGTIALEAGAVLARTGRRDPLTAALAGQTYLDDVIATAIDPARRAMAPMLAQVLRVFEGATDYDDARRKLLALYPAMDPTELRRVLQGATMLAAAAGAWSGRKEAGA